MKIALAQFNPDTKDIKGNVARMKRIIDQEDSDLIVFPELCISGYISGDEVFNYALTMGSDEIKLLQAASKNKRVVFGFIEESESFNFYNSACFFEDGKTVHLHRKIYLPHYGKFDEQKCFSPGSRIESFKLREFTAATLICNDAWHPELPMIASLQNVNVFIVIAAGSYHALGKSVNNKEWWTSVLRTYAMVYGSYVLFANTCGKNGDCLEFFGNSMVIDPYGNIIQQADEEEAVIRADLERENIRNIRIKLPTIRDTKKDFIVKELNRVAEQHDFPFKKGD